VNKNDRLLHKVFLRLNNIQGDILSGPYADLHFIVLRALRTEAGEKVTEVKVVVGGTMCCMDGCMPSSVVKTLLNCA